MKNMVKLHRLLIILACLPMAVIAQNKQLGPLAEHTITDNHPDRANLRLLFAGDAMQHSTQITWAYDKVTNQYNYEPNFRYLQPYLLDADINFVNFETTIPGPPYQGYPRFRSPDAFLDALIAAHFHVYTHANNHIIDADKKGLKTTLDKFGELPHLGAYIDTLSRKQTYPLILNCKGVRMAVFNATYSTNGLVPQPPVFINYIDTVQIRKDIEQSLKDTTIDLRIMIIHWGVEYQLRHNKEQQKIAQWLADRGIDLVIGGHPHVVQDYQLLTTADGRQVPVIYSLGNLISNQREVHTFGGILFSIDYDVVKHALLEPRIIPYYVHKGILSVDEKGNEKNYFCLPTDDYLNNRLPVHIASDSINRVLKSFHEETIERVNLLTTHYDEKNR